MPVLAWVAMAVGAWCVASVITALALGAHLRRRGRAAAAWSEVAGRLDTRPLRMWLAEMPERPAPVVPDTPESLVRDVPQPRAAGDAVASKRAEPTRHSA